MNISLCSFQYSIGINSYLSILTYPIGTLLIPTLADDSGIRGADLLSEPLAVRDWIVSVIPSHITDFTVGMYTYLDSEAHVRVSLACDLVGFFKGFLFFGFVCLFFVGFGWDFGWKWNENYSTNTNIL